MTAPTRGAQVGDEVPDVAPAALRGMWTATQALLRQRRISAGHDVSDGGVAVALLEMASRWSCRSRPPAARWRRSSPRSRGCCSRCGAWARLCAACMSSALPSAPSTALET